MTYSGRHRYYLAYLDQLGPYRGIHPGQSSVTFLPMIDMSSSNPTCIFSTLKFASEHARLHSVTPIVTFDQPLGWKALMIIMTEPLDSDLRKIVFRLGGFHTEMSFLGCIGRSLMAGSRLKEILEMIYAPIQLRGGGGGGRLLTTKLLLC